LGISTPIGRYGAATAAHAETASRSQIFDQGIAGARVQLHEHPGGEALTRLKALGIVHMLRETQRSAAKAHRQIDVAKMIMFGGGGLALVAITAGASAPFVGAAIGEAGGLAGAAAFYMASR
jgi:Trk K+ transport system NAD-binding subunit